MGRIYFSQFFHPLFFVHFDRVFTSLPGWKLYELCDEEGCIRWALCMEPLVKEKDDTLETALEDALSLTLDPSREQARLERKRLLPKSSLGSEAEAPKSNDGPPGQTVKTEQPTSSTGSQSGKGDIEEDRQSKDSKVSELTEKTPSP
jgi:hypothetical protein